MRAPLSIVALAVLALVPPARAEEEPTNDAPADTPQQAPEEAPVEAPDASADDELPSPGTLEPKERKAVADRLFQAAHAALEGGDWDAACAKFRASMRFDISVSTQLNIARCHEHEGKLVAAWEDYNRARLLNRDTPEPERREALAKYTEEAAAKLEARLPRLRVVVPQPPPNLVISSDGMALGQLAAGEPVPLDPGAHVIEVRAPGFRTARLEVELVEGKTEELVVPLEPGSGTEEPPPEAAPTPPVPAPTPPLPPPEPPPDDDPPVWAWVAGAAGLVAGGVAIGLGVDSAAARSELADNCEDRAGTFACLDTRYTQDELDGLVHRANVNLGASVAVGAVGIAALAAAAIGLSLGDERAAATVVVAPGHAGLTLRFER